MSTQDSHWKLEVIDIKKRIFSLFTALVFCLTLLPVPVIAAELEEAGLCPHHRKHTAECGYIPPTEGAPCQHKHESECYAEALACQHVHDEACGYVEADPGQPCGYVCKVCPVQAMIDALPDEREITADNAEEVSARLAAIDEAKAELNDEELDELDFSRYQAVANALTAQEGQAGTNAVMPLAGTLEQSVDGWYLIRTKDDLYAFAGMVNDGNAFEGQTVKLTVDIVVNQNVLTVDGTPNSGSFEEWTPIGYSDNSTDGAGKPFKGTFDGDGHTISGLYFNNNDDNKQNATYYVGLFGYLGVGGTIQNVSVTDSYFKKSQGTAINGGICAYAEESTIKNCYFSGTVQDGSNLGGVCGWANQATITGCRNAGKIVSEQITLAGGVCGYAFNSTISNCCNSESINITVDQGSESILVGGVCGYNASYDDSSKGVLTSCYNTGVISGSGTNMFIGGVCGRNDGTIEKCYYDMSVYTAGDITTGVTGKNTDAFASGEVAWLLNGQQADGPWRQNLGENGDSAPVLDLTHKTVVKGPDGSYFNLLAPDEDGVYLIGSKAELYAFAAMVNGGNTFAGQTVKLTADIVVNSGVLKLDGTLNSGPFEQWTPIGVHKDTSYPNYEKFSGTFDGQNHTVSGLYFNNENTSFVGLFGFSDGVIKNVGVVDSYFHGRDCVGGVCGWIIKKDDVSSGGVIENCWNESTVTSQTTNNNYGDYIGGVCGENFSGTVIGCRNTGKVEGLYEVGGVCGYNLNGGEIINCHNEGAVSGKTYVGGVCGRSRVLSGDAVGLVSNCYNLGTVTGSSMVVGGICGYNGGNGNNDKTCTITTCYNVGAVFCTNGYCGGICGRNYFEVTNCYNTGEVSGSASYGNVGGVCGQGLGGTISNCYYRADCATDGANSVQNGIGCATAGQTTADVAGNTTPKIAEEFASGAVAYLLQGGQTSSQVWGQRIGSTGDTSPVLLSFLSAEEQAARKVCKATFKNDIDEYAVLYANSGGSLAKPSDPTKDNYTFDGWFTDEACMTAWNFDSSTVSGDLTLYAKWTEAQQPPAPVSYTVTFDSQGGSTVSSQTVTAGNKITTPSDPTRSDYIFGGWYTEATCATPWNFDAVVTSSMTLYAKWTAEQKPPEPVVYTVTFNTQGGSTVPSQTVNAGERVAKPANPTRSGYIFGGWYTEAACITAWDFDSSTVSGNLTLYAKWTAKPSGGSHGGGGSSYTPPSYPPTVEKPSEGGSVSIVPGSPSAGDKVTIQPKPDAGYEVDQVTVTDKNGKPVAVTENPDGTFTFTQPGGKVNIEVSYQPVEAPWKNPYWDVSETAWYFDAVRFVSVNSLMNGYGDGRFGPDVNLSRAQLAQILYNHAGRPAVTGASPFTDVVNGEWYVNAITWAAAQGIVGGYGNGLFGPNDNITREQLAVILWRYAGSPAATNKELNFIDAVEAGDFALDALRWAVENGILHGYGDGRLDPKGQATRAQVAAMLMRYLANTQK